MILLNMHPVRRQAKVHLSANSEEQREKGYHDDVDPQVVFHGAIEYRGRIMWAANIENCQQKLNYQSAKNQHNHALFCFCRLRARYTGQYNRIET
ncbi:MAG: hypothetical protein PHI97_02470 [Desulfobulbus sp.]|nr:hypothetical protein [Desulfobulbus sp.]